MRFNRKSRLLMENKILFYDDENYSIDSFVIIQGKERELAEENHLILKKKPQLYESSNTVTGTSTGF